MQSVMSRVYPIHNVWSDDYTRDAYTTVPTGPMPRERTHRPKSWEDEIMKKKLMGRIDQSMSIDHNWNDRMKN